MKTGKSQQKDASYLCKVYLDNWLQRLVWWAFRRYLLNEDHFVVRQKFSGPRHDLSNAYCTKENAVARRMYVEPRKTNLWPMASVTKLEGVAHAQNQAD